MRALPILKEVLDIIIFSKPKPINQFNATRVEVRCSGHLEPTTTQKLLPDGIAIEGKARSRSRRALTKLT